MILLLLTLGLGFDVQEIRQKISARHAPDMNYSQFGGSQNEYTVVLNRGFLCITK